MPELVLVVLVGTIMAAVAVPVINSELTILRVNSATAAVAGAISTTRYRAIMNGYKYAVAFDPKAMTYQVSSQPPSATAFGNVGGAVPITGSSDISLSAATTLQFNPSGTVQATTGQMTFNLSHYGLTKTITVSNLGDVTISQ